MPRGDNLTREMRAKGGRNSHSGSKGGQVSSEHKGRGRGRKKEEKGILENITDKIF